MRNLANLPPIHQITRRERHTSIHTLHHLASGCFICYLYMEGKGFLLTIHWHFSHENIIMYNWNHMPICFNHGQDMHTCRFLILSVMELNV